MGVHRAVVTYIIESETTVLVPLPASATASWKIARESIRECIHLPEIAGYRHNPYSRAHGHETLYIPW